MEHIIIARSGTGPCLLTFVPETSERLYLNYRFEENAFPEKNNDLDRKLLIEYQTFAKIYGVQSDEVRGTLR